MLAAAMPLTAVLPSLAGATAAALAGGAASLLIEVFTETVLAEELDDEVFARAYGFAFPASIGGIVAGSLLAAPLIAAVGLTAALVATGVLVAAYAAGLLVQPSTTPSLSSSQAAISAS